MKKDLFLPDAAPGGLIMNGEDCSDRSVLSDFIVVKAHENGVSVIGLTRGHDTKFAHSEKLDAGEVWIAQFTEFTSAMKIRGRATILTAHGVVESGKPEDETG